MTRRHGGKPLVVVDDHETTVDEPVLFAFLRRRGFVKGHWATVAPDLRDEVRIMAEEIARELAEVQLAFPDDSKHPVRMFAQAVLHGSNEHRNWLLHAAEDFIRGVTFPEAPERGLPLILFCPICRERHIDLGLFATKPHHTHSCQHCGFTWRPAVGPTVGVQFLPGFKDK